MSLSCKLTTEEFEERAKSLAEAHEDRKGLESNHEMLKRQMKSEAAELEAKIDVLAAVVSRKSEMRQVEVEEQADLVKLKAFRYRMDTGEVINERPLTEDERQEKIPLGA
jgi:hypothetical protein